MSKIKIEDIANQLKENNWKVLTKEYKNLETEMVFECFEGHKVYTNWKKLRNKLYCPICEENKNKLTNKTILKKKSGVIRILALDQATYTSGFAIFDDKNLIKYGIYETKLEDEIARDNSVKTWLLNMINNIEPDYIAFEDIQLQGEKGQSSDGIRGVTTYKVLAHLQGILMEAAFEKNIKYYICPPASWRSHCGVKGKAKADKKKSMQLIVKNLYDISVTNDEADAIGIGKYIAETYNKQTQIINWEE